MAIFLLQRLAAFAVTLLVASLVIFLVMEVLPGDPAALMLGVNARPDTLAALRAEMGLDPPAAARYLAWLGGLAIGDLGTSYTYGVSVWELVRERLVLSLPLAVIAICLSPVLAIPLVVLEAALRNRPSAVGVTAFTKPVLHIPTFGFIPDPKSA